MTLKIDADLRLVVPLKMDEAEKPLIYGYHTPISVQVFEANYRVLAATKASLFGRGLAYAMDVGPRIAALQILDEGRRDALSRGEVDADGNPLDGGAAALLAEIKRLTLVLVPGPQGWDQVPVDVAINQGAIDAEDWREGEAAIVFFTAGWSMARRSARLLAAQALAGVMGASITSSPPLEFIASLRNLIPGAASVVPVASSVPS